MPNLANQEHLDMLRQGVETWNKWREENIDVEPNLRFANLSGMSLIDANLSRADLTGVTFNLADLTGAHFIGAKLNLAYLISADLTRADFTYAELISAYPTAARLAQANLTGANLRGSNFTLTNLIDAHLRRADLTDADLTGADLTEAYLESANFTRADLTKTNFTQSYVAFTIFGDVDLSLARGLKTVVHFGPSIIGIDTALRSKGNIPDIFLRQAGVIDTFIEHIHVLSQKPTPYYSCFISYAHQDQQFAEQLYNDLQSNGVRCWYAPQDLKIGDHYHQRIDESIRLQDKLVLILSEHAVRSAGVEREAVAAREKEDHEQRLVLFPLRLDDAVMHTTNAWASDVRRRWLIGDFTRWKDHDAYQQALERLLRDLKAEQSPKD